MEIFNVKDKLPGVECGSYLAYAPQSFPKNSRWVVAEYYDDVKGFYDEATENFMKDVTHWCELPLEPRVGQKVDTGEGQSNIPHVSGSACLNELLTKIDRLETFAKQSEDKKEYYDGAMNVLYAIKHHVSELLKKHYR